MPAKKLSQLKRQKVKKRIPVAPPALEHLDRKASAKADPAQRKAKHKQQPAP